MSNQVALFEGGSLTIPAYLRGELDASTKSLMGNFDGKRISIEGGVFRMIVGGKEVAKNDERSMNVVILRNAETNNRQYYKGEFVPGQKAQAPDCWSDDTITPSSKVKEPQGTHCATCPQNIKGSGSSSDRRACRFFRRTAVMLENDIGGDIYAMTISAQSIFGDDPNKMGFQQYGRFLGGFQLNVNAVVTKLKFDTDASTPKLIFTAARALTEDEYARVKAAVDHKDTLNAISMNPGEIDVAASQPASPYEQPAAPAPKPAPAPAPVAAKPVMTPKPAMKAASGFSVEKAAAEVIPEPTVRTAATVQELVGSAGTVDVKGVLDEWADSDD